MFLSGHPLDVQKEQILQNVQIAHIAQFGVGVWVMVGDNAAGPVYRSDV
jgi:hypothetical protein